MPAINVAKTDTFEVQRQKINEIGTALFGITQGGSDLTTGVLQIGDGTIDDPSLSFISENSIGFYRPLNNVLGITKNGNNIVYFSDETKYFNPLTVVKSSLYNDGLTLTNVGQNYDAGIYQNLSVLNGSGISATATVTVAGFIGDISYGTGYTPGSYSDINFFTSGSGRGAVANFTVSPIQGIISNAGSNYSDGIFESVSLTSITGTGSGAIADIVVSSGSVAEIYITDSGSGYSFGDILTAPLSSGSNFEFTITNTPTSIENLEIINYGSNYTIGDTLTLPGVISTTGTLSDTSTEVSVLDTNGISVGDVVTSSVASSLEDFTIVQAVDYNNNIVSLTSVPLLSGNATLTFTSLYGTGVDFLYTISNVGSITDINIQEGGSGYKIGDILSVSNVDLLQPNLYYVRVVNVVKLTFVEEILSPTIAVGDKIIINGTLTEHTVLETGIGPGSNINYIIIDMTDSTEIFVQGLLVYKLSDPETYYTISSSLDTFAFFISEDFSTYSYKPSLLFKVNDKFRFDLTDSTYTDQDFSLSLHPDGTNYIIENRLTTLSTLSSQITIDTTGILPGMSVTVSSGSSILRSDTTVSEIIDSNSLILSSLPLVGGNCTLNFSGVEYTDNVTKTESYIELLIPETSPSSLYYFSKTEKDTGNEITISQTNLDVLGSGLEITVNNIQEISVVYVDPVSNEVTIPNLTSELSNISTLNSSFIKSDQAELTNLISSNLQNDVSLTFNSPTINLNGTEFNIGDKINININDGNIIVDGELKSKSIINSNDILKISNNVVETFQNNDLFFRPSQNRVVKIDSNSALIIPSGNISERPAASLLENGAIRFNTQTNQYEGYNSSTTAWSSLGGVRDLDNNTYIVAENSVGANDNTLWFYNDDNNTFRFSTNYQTFYSAKKIRSLNTSAPLFVEWQTNTPVTAGQYLKYRNNIYLVTNGGTTGTSGNEPNDTSGNTFTNGSATLQYNTTAVAPLTFEEISEVRIAPLGGTSLVINGDLKLFNNQVTTITNDILLTPPENKKVKVNTTTSLVIPVGTDSQKGSPEVGSIRYNTTINQFEGFNSSLNWTSLGGVRDVDGNTYIIPETGPGTNENILYFYNNNTNTLRVTENQIEFDAINTINSPTSDVLNINASLITLDSLATSIDNTDANTTFISSTKQNFDFGISTGLFNDSVLRIVDTGDLYYNTGFGTGTYNGIKLIDKDLKTLELTNFKIVTESNTLVKGTTDTGSTIIYNPALSVSAKVQIVAYNLTTGDKEFFEYSVVDEVNDVFYTEYGNIKTGAELISAQFSIVPSGVRLTYTLDSLISTGNNILVKIVSQVIKR